MADQSMINASIPHQSEVDHSFLINEHRIAVSLRETLSVLNSSRCLEDILLFIVHQARELLNAQAVAIYTPTGQKGLLAVQAQEGLNEEYVREATIPLGLLATGYATLTRQPVAINDVRLLLKKHTLPVDAESEKILRTLSRHYRALLVVPMIFPKGEVYGTLDLYFKVPRDFSQTDISLAQAYSDQVTLAVENARLRKRVEQTAILSERDRLARDLHDTVSQTLFSASLIADVLPVLWEQDQENGRYALEELKQLSRGALAEMRTLLFELRPAALISADINVLMQQLVNAFNSRTRIPVKYDTQHFNCSIPSDVKIALYRITQELLHNIEKHAHASEVFVSFKPGKSNIPEKRSLLHCYNCDKCIFLSISDNGCGFDPDSVTADHMGLRIVRERAEGIKANLHVKSSPGKGTCITIIW